MDIIEAVKDHFSSGTIEDVELKVERSADGAPVLKIRVIYDGSATTLLPDEMLSLSMSMRPITESLYEDTGFPVVSYLDMRDIEPLHAAQ
ncbi:MAG: hypothetical protein HLUCCO18_01490 [Rhodobacteraceae bacterium HLUCCO18]|nr:MAG: hypothetical protein HLUCCO18_01490 [Rhodobacteraceae bacterium HLUCCO18]